MPMKQFLKKFLRCIFGSEQPEYKLDENVLEGIPCLVRTDGMANIYAELSEMEKLELLQSAESKANELVVIGAGNVD